MRVPLQHCLPESKPYDKYVEGRCVLRLKRSCNRLKLRWQAWGPPVGWGGDVGKPWVFSTIEYYGACLNSGSQWENDHHYFTEGPLLTLTTVTLFRQDPRDTEYRVRGWETLFGHYCLLSRKQGSIAFRPNTPRIMLTFTLLVEIAWHSFRGGIIFSIKRPTDHELEVKSKNSKENSVPQRKIEFSWTQNTTKTDEFFPGNHKKHRTKTTAFWKKIQPTDDLMALPWVTFTSPRRWSHERWCAMWSHSICSDHSSI